MRPWLATLVIAAFACGPKPGPAPRPTDPDAKDAAPPRVDPASPAASPRPLTRDECVRLVDHVLEIGMADQRARKAPASVPTAEQVAKIRAEMIAEQVPPCLEMPRSLWECAMAARSMAKLYECGGGEPPDAK